MAENTNAPSGLLALSDEIADVVGSVADAVVRVDDGSRLPASGIVWSADGLIVATSHGVERDEELNVEFENGERRAAELVGRDSDTDLALLRVEASGLNTLTFANAPRVGQLALALGRPGGSSLQVTSGLVSARIDTATNERPSYILYTDATLYRGFSGGPLIDAAGRLLGVNNLMFGRGRGVAVGAPTVDEVVKQIMGGGPAQRGYLGVRTQVAPLPELVRTAAGQDRGLLIVNVEEGSPAQAGGLWIGDTLLKVAGRPTLNVDDLRGALRASAAGSTVSIMLLRAGEVTKADVTLGVHS